VLIFLLLSVDTAECERLFSLKNAEISTTFQADAEDTCQHGCCGIVVFLRGKYDEYQLPVIQI
jgi:hypothetical protein